MMSTTRPLPAATPTAVRAGADLRAARERLGWTLSEISERLRIRLCYLQALEDGDISLLPGNAYVVGHVRAYARALGLDAQQMVRRFKAEAAAVDRRTELVFPVPMPERGLPLGAVMLVGLVLSIGAYVGWYRLSGEGRLPAETVTAIPERLAPLAEQAIPPRVMPEPARVIPPPANPAMTAEAGPTSPPAAAAPVNADPAPPVAAISPTSAAASLVRDPAPDQLPGHATTSAAKAAAPEPEASRLDADGPDAGRPDAGQIVLRASADAWIQVKDRSGVILLTRTLKAGETWPVPRQDNLLLTTGNAGATEILLDGAPTFGLGSPGAVRRDMPLDADMIKEGKLAAALPPASQSARPRQ